MSNQLDIDAHISRHLAGEIMSIGGTSVQTLSQNFSSRAGADLSNFGFLRNKAFEAKDDIFF